jgi:hypothetical protein
LFYFTLSAIVLFAQFSGKRIERKVIKLKWNIAGGKCGKSIVQVEGKLAEITNKK